MKTFFSLLALSGLFAFTSVPGVAQSKPGFAPTGNYTVFLYQHPGGGGRTLVMSNKLTYYYDLSKNCWARNLFGNCTVNPTDQISSVYVSFGCLQLWEHPGYQGRSILLSEGKHDLGPLGFDDITTSAKWYSISEPQCKLGYTFGYIKNSRLVASGSPPEPMPGHVNWALNTGQSESTVKRVTLEQLEQARSLIVQSASMQSCEAFGYMKNGMLALLRYIEPHQGHVNWCRDRLNEGNWGQVVSAMDQELVNPIRSKLGG